MTDEHAASLEALPWGTDLSSWSDPAPTEAPAFLWQDQWWQISFDFLDSEQERALTRRVLQLPRADWVEAERQLRLAWSINEWNGKPFVQTVVQQAVIHKRITPEQVDDPQAVQAACEAFMLPVKGPLLAKLAECYQAAAKASLGILEEMRADPHSAGEPSMPGGSLAYTDYGQEND